MTEPFFHYDSPTRINPLGKPKRKWSKRTGRFKVGDKVRNRISGTEGVVLEVFGSTNTLYRFRTAGGSIMVVAEQHVEEVKNGQH